MSNQTQLLPGQVRPGDEVLARDWWWRIDRVDDFGWFAVESVEPGPSRRRIHQGDIREVRRP